jgi:REP element-mobilizing transposase RayT
MSHTYCENIIHVVFSTKERRKTIAHEMKERLWAYMAAICKKDRIFVHAIGGIEDHVHLLLQIPATLSVAKAVLDVKANSSKWMSRQGDQFALQEGYGAFSVSRSDVKTVVQYIRNQEQHHAKMSFEEEFLALLKENDIDYDPRYVFG